MFRLGYFGTHCHLYAKHELACKIYLNRNQWTKTCHISSVNNATRTLRTHCRAFQVRLWLNGYNLQLANRIRTVVINHIKNIICIGNYHRISGYKAKTKWFVQSISYDFWVFRSKVAKYSVSKGWVMNCNLIVQGFSYALVTRLFPVKIALRLDTYILGWWRSKNPGKKNIHSKQNQCRYRQAFQLRRSVSKVLLHLYYCFLPSTEFFTFPRLPKSAPYFYLFAI